MIRHEKNEFKDVQIIGLSKQIAFKNPAECAKFWEEYVERIVKPVYKDGKDPDFKFASDAQFLEWYNGADISSPDYKCGVIMALQ